MESEAKKDAAERYFAYAREKLDELTAEGRAYYESQRRLPPPAPVEDTVAPRTTDDQEVALSLITLSHGNNNNANAESTASAQTELASLQSLQKSIEDRIRILQEAQHQET